MQKTSNDTANARENTRRPLFTMRDLFSDKKKTRRELWQQNSQIQGQTRIIEQLGIEDLTQAAFAGRYRPPVGLRRETLELETILMQRFANTPLIHGVNGPGKSTLPLKLAFRIINGQCHTHLRRHRLLRMDLSLLTAGAGMRGEIEERMKHYFRMADENPHIITVIDECQRLVGNHLYEGEIIHCLKTRLGSGRYKMILITDAANVNLLTEDPAIMGRVTLLEVTPPDKRRTVRLFKNGIGPDLESHYKIRLPMELVDEAFQLSEELMPYERAQPSRTIKLIDYAMAAAARRPSLQTQTPFPTLAREALQVSARRFGRTEQLHLTAAQRRQRLLGMTVALKQEIIGQDEVIEAVAAYLMGNMEEKPSQPGILFFMGDSGTGKTSLAQRLGNHYSGDQATVRLDCSQLIDAWGTTSLLGSYPGLVWSDRSSFLSLVRNHCYATFIFDEIEKAHPAIIRLFLQILSEPYCIRDNRGVKLDFSKSLIIFTSNIGHSSGDRKKVGFINAASQGKPLPQQPDQNLGRTLVRYFPEEFIGRLKNHIYRFRPLERESQKKITEMEITRRAARLGLEVKAAAGVIEFLLQRAEVDLFGVRSIHAAVGRWIDPILQTLNDESPSPGKIHHLVMCKGKICPKK